MKKRNKKPSTTNFNDPQKGFDSTSKRIVFALMIVLVLVMIATYIFISMKYGSLSNMFLGETTETTVEETTEEIEVKNVDGKKNLLIAVTSPGESELYNVFMVGINMSENKTSFLSVPVYTLDSSERTLAEEFKLGGISQIEYVLERMFDIDFDGYMSATQNGYKFFLTELGKSVSFDVPEDLQFSTTNYTVSLSAGKQELSFDTFVKLMMYDAWQGGKDATFTMQGNLLQAAYEQYMKPKYISRDVDSFTYKMTHINGDISSEDYVNDLDALEYIAATKFSLRVLTPAGTFSTKDGSDTFRFSKKGITAVHDAFTLAPVQP
ncbi:MAG: hypothetical protein IJG23_01785 [Clostridia bacterium]|nr:hypothetical protein [Clostridia bacterium]